MTQTEKYTNADFAFDLNRLTDAQLGQPAYYWGENCGGILRSSKGEELKLVELYAGYNALATDGRRAKAQVTWDLPDEKVTRHIIGITILEEDHINPSGDSCEPMSAYLKGHPNCHADSGTYDTEAEIREEHEVAYPAGTVIIELY